MFISSASSILMAQSFFVKFNCLFLFPYSVPLQLLNIFFQSIFFHPVYIICFAPCFHCLILSFSLSIHLIYYSTHLHHSLHHFLFNIISFTLSPSSHTPTFSLLVTLFFFSIPSLSFPLHPPFHPALLITSCCLY